MFPSGRFAKPGIITEGNSTKRHWRITMNKLLTAFLLTTSALPLFGQGSPPHNSADQPYVMEYYYKTQWGHQQEFLQLFLKNHYPLLKKVMETGRIIGVKIESPANHLPEDARWDYRVTIRFQELGSWHERQPGRGRNDQATLAGSGDL